MNDDPKSTDPSHLISELSEAVSTKKSDLGETGRALENVKKKWGDVKSELEDIRKDLLEAKAASANRITELEKLESRLTELEVNPSQEQEIKKTDEEQTKKKSVRWRDKEFPGHAPIVDQSYIRAQDTPPRPVAPPPSIPLPPIPDDAQPRQRIDQGTLAKGVRSNPPGLPRSGPLPPLDKNAPPRRLLDRATLAQSLRSNPPPAPPSGPLPPLPAGPEPTQLADRDILDAFPLPPTELGPRPSQQTQLPRDAQRPPRPQPPQEYIAVKGRGFDPSGIADYRLFDGQKRLGDDLGSKVTAKPTPRLKKKENMPDHSAGKTNLDQIRAEEQNINARNALENEAIYGRLLRKNGDGAFIIQKIYSDKTKELVRLPPDMVPQEPILGYSEDKDALEFPTRQQEALPGDQYGENSPTKKTLDTLDNLLGQHISITARLNLVSRLSFSSTDSSEAPSMASDPDFDNLFYRSGDASESTIAPQNQPSLNASEGQANQQTGAVQPTLLDLAKQLRELNEFFSTYENVPPTESQTNTPTVASASTNDTATTNQPTQKPKLKQSPTPPSTAPGSRPPRISSAHAIAMLHDLKEPSAKLIGYRGLEAVDAPLDGKGVGRIVKVFENAVVLKSPDQLVVVDRSRVQGNIELKGMVTYSPAQTNSQTEALQKSVNEPTPTSPRKSSLKH